MPLHIACMYHLSHLHSKLFVLAHEMVDREPENPVSWYAVGVWYLSGSKWAQARQYFRFVAHELCWLIKRAECAMKQNVIDGPSVWACVDCVRTYIRSRRRA